LGPVYLVRGLSRLSRSLNMTKETNQRNQIDQTDQMNQIDQILLRAASSFLTASPVLLITSCDGLGDESLLIAES